MGPIASLVDIEGLERGVKPLNGSRTQMRLQLTPAPDKGQISHTKVCDS